MKKYCVAYIATNKHGTIVDNQMLWMPSAKLTEQDMHEIKDCIRMRNNYASVAILNVMALENS